jgi:hypothetical protein
MHSHALRQLISWLKRARSVPLHACYPQKERGLPPLGLVL